MHGAPSVSYPVGRCRFEGWALSGVGGLSGVVVGVWSFVSPFTWRHSVAWLVLCACALLAFRVWRRAVRGVLRWDGGAWTWICGTRSCAVQIRVVLDLQSVVLAKSSLNTRWFWLEARHAPSRWPDLRRAVYSRAIDDALQQPGGRSAADIAP